MLRVMLGVIYVMHGWLALVSLGPSVMAAYTVRLGYPPSLSSTLAWYLIVAQLVGGALLVPALNLLAQSFLQSAGYARSPTTSRSPTTARRSGTRSTGPLPGTHSVSARWPR